MAKRISVENGKRDLFYSESDKMLFYVAGYTDNSDNVQDILETMNDGVNVMVEICEGKIEKKDVNTTYVDKSRRYKSMRVFYVKNVEDSIVPKEAFRLGTENGWTMWKWLEN